MSQKRIGILTLGCRVNLYESTAIAEALEKEGFDVVKGADEEECDVYVVNTCSVTAESHRQSGQTVRKCASKGKTAVLGCASQQDAEKFLSIPNVFYVGGSRNKSDVVRAILELTGEAGRDSAPVNAVLPMDRAPYEPMRVSGEGKVPLFSTCRAFVKIQDGCGARCSYCVIPAVRGPSRSRPLEDILEEADRLAEAGYKELIFTGISVSSFVSGGRSLPDLVAAMGEKKEKGIERVRFGSVSPGSVTERFLREIADSPNFMPHVHLSLQSGSGRILKLMNRPYTPEEAMEKIRRLRSAVPRMELSADFITGFPTETEEDYGLTEKFVREAGLLHVHAFPYSERKGTPAAAMEGSVPKEIRKDRCARLNGVSEALKEERMRRKIGTKVVLLTEKAGRGHASGHTEEFMECRVRSDTAGVGEILTAAVTGLEPDGKYLTGEIVYEQQ